MKSVRKACDSSYDAIGIVFNKHYSGQASLFTKYIAQSCGEEKDFWVVSVYVSTIFGAVDVTTYHVPKKQVKKVKDISPYATGLV